MLRSITYFMLAPALYLQGRRVQRSIPRLPEPRGARSGSKGNGSLLRMLVVGDSAAAGVGAPSLDEALPGRLVAEFSRNHRVEWKLIAKTGATTELINRRLKKHKEQPFDIAVTSLGVNEVTSSLKCEEWIRQPAELRSVLRERFGVSHMFVSGLPPVGRFPALPQPLRWYLGKRARQFDNSIRAELTDEEGVTCVDLRFSDDQTLMAEDGFHPGPAIYQEWAARIYREYLSLQSVAHR